MLALAGRATAKTRPAGSHAARVGLVRLNLATQFLLLRSQSLTVVSRLQDRKLSEPG